MNYTIRTIQADDYHKGYLDLLSELTTVGTHSRMEFKVQINAIMNKNDIIYVIEQDNKLVGTGKLVIEDKLHNNFSRVGHIEDIVIKKEYRKKGFGKILIDKLIEIGKDNECYKVILNCDPKNVKFYEKCGFKEKNVEMSLYF